jgi:hypothetical protein
MITTQYVPLRPENAIAIRRPNRTMGDLQLPFDITPERVILALIAAVLLYQFVQHFLSGREMRRKARRSRQLQALEDDYQARTRSLRRS